MQAQPGCRSSSLPPSPPPHSLLPPSLPSFPVTGPSNKGVGTRASPPYSDPHASTLDAKTKKARASQNHIPTPSFRSTEEGIPQYRVPGGDHRRAVLQEFKRSASDSTASLVPREKPPKASLWRGASSQGAQHTTPHPPPPVLNRKFCWGLLFTHQPLPKRLHRTAQPTVGEATEGIRRPVCPQRFLGGVRAVAGAQEDVSDFRNLQRDGAVVSSGQEHPGYEGPVLRSELPATVA